MATFGTFVSGQTLTAAELNTAGEWSSYTPTWTQGTTITKTVSWARYMQLNKLVIVNLRMVATNDGTANNTILIGLPVAASSNNLMMGYGNYVLFNLNGNRYPVFAFYDSSTTVKFQSTASNTFNTTFLGATAVDDNDIWNLCLTYEAA